MKVIKDCRAQKFIKIESAILKVMADTLWRRRKVTKRIADKLRMIIKTLRK